MKGCCLCVALWVTIFAVWSPASTSEASADIDRQIEQARSLFDNGHTAEARKAYQSALDTLQGRDPSKQLGFVLNAMSQISAADGDYDKAAQFAQRSADCYRQLADPEGEAHAWNNKGIAEIQAGGYATAQRDLEKALELSRRANDAENQTQILNNLGSAYYFPGNYSDALRRYDEAMRVVDQNGESKWSAYWRQITSFNQATLYQRLGRYEKALDIYRQVDASSQNLTPSDRAHLYANLGALYRRLGDPYKALTSYRTAQQFYTRQHDAGGEITVLKNIGIVYALDLDDPHRAEAMFQSALLLARKTHNRREEMQAHLYLGESNFRAHDLAHARPEFETALALATELNTLEEQWKSEYGLGKIADLGRDYASAEVHYRRAISVIEKTRSQLQLSSLRSEFFADKREAYDALIGLLFQKKDTQEAFLFLERARSRVFQDRLITAKDGPSVPKPLTLQEARSHLPPTVVLLEFWTSGDRIGLIWCTQDASGISEKQLSSSDRGRVRESLNRIPDSQEGNWRQQAEALDSILPDSAAFGSTIHDVIVVPDGWISYVPFDLLRTTESPRSLWIDKYAISYLPSATLLRRNPPAGRMWMFPWTSELVAFGDPLVPAPQAAADRSAAQPLPYSGEEIRSIAKITNGVSRLFLQHDDLKKHFLGGTANRAFLLHVSTHAYADSDSPENSRLLFSPPAAGADADYVFLRELYELELGSVQLATISACDTERGKMVRGEGVQAFSRALLSAGARSSLTSLWHVDDETTAEFMKQFYFFAITKNKPKAEALRLAKLKFLNSNSRLQNPQYWAAFSLYGDGVTPLPAVVSWASLVLAGTVISILLSAAIWLLLRRQSRFNRL